MNANHTEETPSQEEVLEESAPAPQPALQIEPEIDAHDHPEPTPASMADFDQFLQALRAARDAEAKLEMTIQFMQERLAQTGIPHFKEFWDARRVCLDLFKENINPSVRVALWAKYSELCRQARRLKEIFDEQSAFAAEQIEMAVEAIENDVANFAELLDTVPQIDFGIDCQSLMDHFEEYNSMQRELNLLNTYAMKTSSLRKELIKTEMRIRQKNKFFERLSKLGDAIFPRRKQLIVQVSEQFINDVERFITTTFVSELKTVELFSARDEIKALQSIAKVLTLNTEAFSQTRQRLSECWDSIKTVVKERRKVVSEQKTAYKKHRDEFAAELDAMKNSYATKELNVAQIEAKLDDLVFRMRQTALGKLEIRELRDKARELRQVLSSHAQTEEMQRRQDAFKKEQERKARIDKLKEELHELAAKVVEAEIEAIDETLQTLSKEVANLVVPRAQKQEFEKMLRNIRDLITEKKEQKLLMLSEDDLEAINKLKDLLKERKAHRQEIKTQLEAWRKESGSSGLDIGQAMQLNDLIAAEKVRLERIEAGIGEIEEKIAKLQGK